MKKNRIKKIKIIRKNKEIETILKELLNFLTIELTVLLTAALPIVELRAGISFGLSPLHAITISFIGSMVLASFIFFIIRNIFDYLKQIKLLM